MRDIGRYRVQGVLGSGGMGTVYRVQLLPEGRLYALKRVKAERCGPDGERRFHREAAIARTLQHPNLVQVVDFGLDDEGGLYLAMELLDGEDLYTRLARGPLAPDEVARVGLGAAAGLAAAHRAGIVHRDMKPANLFLGSDGSVKVLDFGLAISCGDVPQGRFTTTGVFVGTPSYMAPEQALALHTEDPRTDVWGLCATLYRAVAGRPPFDAPARLAQAMRVIHEDPDPLPDSVPEALADVILRGLRKDKAERYQSMDELAAALGAIAAKLVGARAAPATPAAAHTSDATLPNGREISTVALGPRGAVALHDEIRVVSVLVGEEVLDLPAFRAAVAAELGQCTALVGDCAVGIFGGDAWRGDEAERAVRAGLKVREGSVAFLLGVATGRAQLGAGAISGAVVSKAEEVLSSEGVGLDDETQRRVLGAFQVAGRRVVSTRRSGSLLGVMGLAGSDMPLYGRERELEQLLGEARAALRTPRAGGAVLVGPSGIGKSRLRHAMEVDLLQERDDIAMLRGHAEAQRALHGWHPFASALRGWVGIPEGAPASAIRSRIAARVPAGTAPFLAEILGAQEADAPELVTARGDVSVMAARVRGALATLFDSIASQRPTVLVLEDLQWADAATLDTIELLLRSLADRPFFLVGTSRTELPRSLHGLTRMPIGPLSPDAVQALVEGLLGPSPVVAAIAARSEGNPLFAEELALGAQAGQEELPMTVEAAVRARLDSLERQDLDLLRRAAVLGQRFSVEGLVTLGARDPEPALVRLRRRDLVVPWSRARSGGLTAWCFRHDLVREVLYATLTAEQRRALHALAGRWLAAAAGALPDEAAAHLEKAGLQEEAGPLWKAACQRAFREGDLRLALAASERAIATTPAAELFELHRARVEILVFTGADQSAALAALAASARTPTEQAIVAYRRSQQLRRAGDAARALSVTREGLSACPTDVQLRAQELRLLAEQGTDVGRRIWELADVARQLPSPVERANVLFTLSACLTARGDLVSALPLLSEAEVLFDEAGHTPRVAAVRADIAEILQHLHPPESALRASHAAVAACRAAGNVVDECGTLRCLGLASARVGDRDGGQRALAASEAIAGELDLPRMAVAARATAALVLLEQGDWGGALERVAGLLGRPRAERRSLEPALRGLQAAALLGLGRVDEAREAARRGLSERTGVAAPELGEEALFVAAHEAGLPGALDAGVGALVTSSQRILDPEHRRRYLRGTPARVRLLELGRAAGMPVPADTP